MNQETLFRLLFVLAFIAMTIIRVFFQSKVLQDERKVEIQEGGWSLLAGSIAALTTIVFGIEYILSPGTFSFAYVLAYPFWLRWLGAFLLACGIILLGWAHYHLGRSFHSLVVSKENQVLVKTGPYHWIRHPIYTAYFLSYIGGGLLAGNVILTFVPALMYVILVAIRMDAEEAMLQEKFGEAYREYMHQTGRLLPKIRRRV